MQATTLALEHLLCAVGDPVRELSGIGPDHPDFVRAQTIRAAAGVLAKAPEAFPAIVRAVQATAPATLSPRARSHLAAAEAWVAGDPLLAAESYAFILSRWPNDLLAAAPRAVVLFLPRPPRPAVRSGRRRRAGVDRRPARLSPVARDGLVRLRRERRRGTR